MTWPNDINATITAADAFRAELSLHQCHDRLRDGRMTERELNDIKKAGGFKDDKDGDDDEGDTEVGVSFSL